jgi:hypothetical protein
LPQQDQVTILSLERVPGVGAAAPDTEVDLLL